MKKERTVREQAMRDKRAELKRAMRLIINDKPSERLQKMLRAAFR